MMIMNIIIIIIIIIVVVYTYDMSYNSTTTELTSSSASEAQQPQHSLQHSIEPQRHATNAAIASTAIVISIPYQFVSYK